MYQEFYETKAGFYKSVEGLGVGVEEARAAADGGGGGGAGGGSGSRNPNELAADGPKISCLVAPTPSDDELRFLQQMGVTHCFTWISNEQSTLDFVVGLRERLARAGLQLWMVGNRALGKNPEVILGTEEREAGLVALSEFVRMLGRAGVPHTTFTWEADGVWNTHTGLTRGETVCRAVDADALRRAPRSREREYSDDELWASLEFFLDRMLPVAEEARVRLLLHPNDPPIERIAGIPCLIRNREAYERVFRLAKDSPWLGMEFCCGCWLEGGDGFGPIFASLGDYVRRKKVAIVHLRNVTAPLPAFCETFIDGGYGDVYRLCRTLVRNEYQGTIILDHTPQMVESAGPGAATAFAIGYIKAAVRAADAERKGMPED